MTENNEVIKALKTAEREFKSKGFSSVNDLVKELQDSMPERGLGARYASVILKAVTGQPWQLDSELPEQPLTNFLRQKAAQGDYTATHLLKKMNLK